VQFHHKPDRMRRATSLPVRERSVLQGLVPEESPRSGAQFGGMRCVRPWYTVLRLRGLRPWTRNLIITGSIIAFRLLAFSPFLLSCRSVFLFTSSYTVRHFDEDGYPCSQSRSLASPMTAKPLSPASARGRSVCARIIVFQPSSRKPKLPPRQSSRV